MTVKRILILNANPDPGTDRLTHALARAYHGGAEEAGHVAPYQDRGD